MGGKPLGQSSCWQIYDQWIDSGQAVFLDEPRDLERSLRAEARTQLVATKLWMDSYGEVSAMVLAVSWVGHVADLL